MQAQDYEAASIRERENAKAVQRAADQATIDQPGTEVINASLCSKTAPLSNENLRIQGPRWYVETVIRKPDKSEEKALYRVWQDSELQAARVIQ
jgi:hypothetical protein